MSSNVIDLRKNQPYKVRNKVCIGIGNDIFVIAGLGLAYPQTSEFMGHVGKIVNGSEFIQLQVPGIENRVFNIHKDFVRRAQ